MNRHSTILHEAWIDVGGTFTDCYLRPPSGPLKRTKVLSSGKVPLSIGSESTQDRLLAVELTNDPTGFWVGANVRLTRPDYSEVALARVVAFQDGVMQLDRVVDYSPALRAELETGLEAPVLATRRLLGTALRDDLPPLRVRLGTTKGTNALLTRSGARTALAITSPLEDLLLIGDQTRPHLFELAIKRPAPLAERVIGIHERLDARGSVLQPLDQAHARQALEQARQAGCESLAICLMHSYVNPQHELQLLELAQQAGFTQVSCSSQLAPLIEIVPRAQTAVVDAYLSPIIRGYLQRLVNQFGGSDAVQLLVMTSAGGLVDWQDYSGKDSILSGPAGGVAALRQFASKFQTPSPTGMPPELIGLDMGGTSTDVCRVSSDHNLQYESTKAGVRIFTPTLPIETVAAGGGSVCWYDGVSLRVGPQSAGASPGPACYGRGGPLTITDLNVFLGRVPASQFPFPIDHLAIAQRLQQGLEEARDLGFSSPAELAHGYRRLANEQMAAAVRTVSIAQGVDPRTQILVGFGGAAGQHICEIAEQLDIRRVFDSTEAGLLSALGMGLAERRLDSVVSVYRQLSQVDWNVLANQTHAAEERLLNSFIQQGISPQELHSAWWLELRYAKTEATLTLRWPAAIRSVKRSDIERFLHEFATAHRQRYGYSRSLETPVELVAARIEVTTASHQQFLLSEAPMSAGVNRPPTRVEESLNTEEHSTQWVHYRRHELCAGQQLFGPAIVLNVGSTLVLESGWRAMCQDDGLLVLDAPQRAKPRSLGGAVPLGAELGQEKSRSHPRLDCQPVEQAFDPVFRDCFAQRLSAIATQMGVVLQHTAVSVNVKQRRDFSCAVFDRQGNLLASAPHVPVHLGAMGQTVRAMLAEFPQPRPGDSFITNDPYRGGSHLPDVTIVTPLFASEQAAQPQFFVANRAHHADIGGVAPGSMSVVATRLGEEGVVIPPMHLTIAGSDCSSDLKAVLQSSPFPPRNIDENLADITAQLAANARGVELLSEFAATTSWTQLLHYSGHVLDATEHRVRNFLKAHRIAKQTFTDHLDDGTKIQVAVASDAAGELSIDFSGSGPTSDTNFNANRSIVSAAVIYVLRCLIADDLPLNEGVMRCVRLTVPAGVLDPPPRVPLADSPAVAAGNVETSQRVVDVLLGALGASAASQGTMNNLLFGNRNFGFYETICGGAGATCGSHGASGVHTHMTNTRLTDPEVLEARYPVRLHRFGLRTGSGGCGRWNGGEGVIRELEFLEPVELSLLTSRRGPYAPFGLDGGQAGSLGYNTLVKTDGSRVRLAGCCQLQMVGGERLEIETPGGGGWGCPGPSGSRCQTNSNA